MESTRLPPTGSGSRHSCGSNDGSTLTPSPPCRNDNFPHQQRTGRHSNRPGMGQQRSQEPHHQMPHSRIHQRPCIRPPTHRNHLGSPTKNITPTATPLQLQQDELGPPQTGNRTLLATCNQPTSNRLTPPRTCTTHHPTDNAS